MTIKNFQYKYLKVKFELMDVQIISDSLKIEKLFLFDKNLDFVNGTKKKCTLPLEIT
jgi:hypothetical protein